MTISLIKWERTFSSLFSSMAFRRHWLPATCLFLWCTTLDTIFCTISNRSIKSSFLSPPWTDMFLTLSYKICWPSVQQEFLLCASIKVIINSMPIRFISIWFVFMIRVGHWTFGIKIEQRNLSWSIFMSFEKGNSFLFLRIVICLLLESCIDVACLAYHVNVMFLPSRKD